MRIMVKNESRKGWGGGGGVCVRIGTEKGEVRKEIGR